MEELNDHLPTTPAGINAYLEDYHAAHLATQAGIPQAELDHSGWSIWAVDATVAAYSDFSKVTGRLEPEPDPMPLVPNVLTLGDTEGKRLDVKERLSISVRRVAAFAGATAVRGAETSQRLIIKPIARAGLHMVFVGGGADIAAVGVDIATRLGYLTDSRVLALGTLVTEWTAGSAVVTGLIGYCIRSLEDEPKTVEINADATEAMERLATIEEKISADPDVNFTPDELRFLYQLDGVFEHDVEESYRVNRDYGLFQARYESISTLRELRGNRDAEDLVRILPETIRDQLKAAYLAYDTVAAGLGLKRRLFGKGERLIRRKEFEQLFAQKDKEWQENGVYDYLVEQTLENGLRHTLVVTPNVAASGRQIVALAEAFGNEQSLATEVNSDIYQSGKYTPQELSGNAGIAPVRFSLIPHRFDESAWLSSGEQMMYRLREKQDLQPNLQFRIPSVLDAVTYWNALCAQGDALRSGSPFQRTFICHFDLESNEQVCCQSCVADGSVRLTDSNFMTARYARLAVG